MRKPLMLCTLVVMTMLGLAGCQRITYTTNPARGIYAGTLAKRTGRMFNIQRKQHFLLWGWRRSAWPIWIRS